MRGEVIMEPLVLQPTSTAQWHSLINEAIHSSGIQLQEDLESYLVFLLMRYIGHNQLTTSLLALEFLNAYQLNNLEGLRNVGDKCLLFSGLFPGRALRRKINIDYYIKLGKSAYGSLGKIKQKQMAKLYIHLSQEFVSLMDVLHFIREMTATKEAITMLQLFELWDERESVYALHKLKTITNQSLPVRPPNNKKSPLN